MPPQLGPVVAERPAIVAPDFDYATAERTATLKDHRGERFVLLVLTSGRDARPQRLAAAANALEAARIDVLFVPAKAGLAVAYPGISVVTEGNQEIHATYAVLADILDDFADRPAHAEFLIDRSGYVRARWLPARDDAWRDPAAIVKQVEILAREKRNTPLPDDHVH